MLMLLAAAAVALAPATMRAQSDTSAFYQGMNLEGAGHFRDAAVAYRRALAQPRDRVNALLGLERAYARVGWTDSLLPTVDSLVRLYPGEAAFRGVQLRAYTMLGRAADARLAFESWARRMPGQPDAYRAYARLLLQQGKAAEADSIIRMGGARLGGTTSLAMELAQSQAALGQWTASTLTWRTAVAGNPGLAQAAAFALAPAPATARDSIRNVLLRFPPEAGARRTLSELEMVWGAPAAAWAALRDLPADSATVIAWLDFAQRAEAGEQWALARNARVAALRWRREPGLSIQAATDALNAGDASTALALLPDSGLDSARVAAYVLPVRAQALAQSGKPGEAQALVRAYARFLSPGELAPLQEAVAFGWVRRGELDSARVALHAAGPGADSSAAAGWVALYEGNLAGARAMLKNSSEVSPQLAEALGMVTRVEADTATDIGAAFLLLARLDSSGAAAAFTAMAPRHGDVGSAMLALAARIDEARHADSLAVAAWSQVVNNFPKSPEAAGAELAWARYLGRTGRTADAVTHLEHLILTYPGSALVPQARRELELARSAIPGTGPGGGRP
jgi:tetratricopeptide (TPR) repeat protein